MDRQRSLDAPIKTSLLALLLLLGSGLANGLDAGPPAPAAGPGKSAEAVPIERQPYRIALHLVADPDTRIDGALQDQLVQHWRALVHRFIGPAWTIEVAEPPSPLVGNGLGRLKAEDLTGFDPVFDKIWLVWISRDPKDSSLVFTGREYDSATRWLGPLQSRKATSPRDLSRTFFQFTTNLFSPSALIIGQEGGRALLKVQGAAITPASELGAVVAKGTTFIPLRLVSMKDGSVRITRIAYSYLTTESVEGSIARCAIISAFRDPLTQRIARPNTLAALGIKPGDSPLHLRFLNKTDKGAAAGYTLTERAAPDGPPREVGLTDRSGRITVEPGPTRGIVKLRLLAGGLEPLAEFPIMPGESSEEREITVDPLPLAAKYQVQLDALRDQVIDQVALRGRLERLMQARADGEDWAGLEQFLKEYAQLPAPSTFAETLKKMKDEATKQSYETTKTTVLTKNLQAQFSDLDALIGGYLADDAFVAYSEALKQKKADVAEASKPAKPVVAPPAASAKPASPEAPPQPAAAVGKTPATPAKPASGVPF